MKVFYDCEFLEDGQTIELISIGMVRQDGKEYYAINGNMPWARIINHGWLRDNVVPHLPTLHGIAFLDHGKPEVKPNYVIAREVEAFLLDAFEIDGELELWSWYGAYDYVALCQLWGPMVDLPSFVPQYTNDIQQEFRRFDNPQHNITEGTHNALEDAHYHKALHEFIVQVGKERYREAVLEALHPELGYWCDLDNLHQEKN